MRFFNLKRSIIITILSVIAVIALIFAVSGSPDNVADCTNGYFEGVYESDTGILSFKGIPYAKAPVGELRWKAPVEPEKSQAIIKADKFGDSSIQYHWFSEDIKTDVSENCLSLNIWTKNLKNDKRPVMVFFHGGSFAWGGTSEDIYNGQYIVNEHNDVVVVTVNYRLGMMGFIDFSTVEGGENFPYSKELGLMDCVQALKWIKKNIKSFGGNPKNITIFGESAGGTIVSCLLASDYAGDLFQRVISQSGTMKMTYTDDMYYKTQLTNNLLKASGCLSMDELTALSTEQLIEINETTVDEDGNCINDLYNLPLRGGEIAKADYFDAIRNASEKGVDLLIGSNANEINYWIIEMGEKPLYQLTNKEIETNLFLFENYYIKKRYERLLSVATEEQKKNITLFLQMNGGENDFWAKSQLFTESTYRQPAIKAAEAHSYGGNGNTFMYYFAKENDSSEFLGACHSIDLPYVFHNLTPPAEYGNVDVALADCICEAWVNFAKTGDPSSENIKWNKYDAINRYTMIIGNDSTFTEKSNPDKEFRELLSWTADSELFAAGD